MSEEAQGMNCTFLFKKRQNKNKGTRKRRNSSSEEGNAILRYKQNLHYFDCNFQNRKLSKMNHPPL